MKSQDIMFEHELEVFRKEAEAGIQFLYAYLAVHAVAADHKSVYQLLNQAPLFWNTNLGALQTAAFMALGRVFDQKSAHNLDVLIRMAQNHLEIFSKTALGRRKQGTDPAPPEWLDDFLRNAYEPTPEDFRRLRAQIRRWRKIYESNYRDIRRKLFAHKGMSEQAQIDALVEKTNVKELQRMSVFLGSFHDALWQLFYNGRKPVLRPRPYSLDRMRHNPLPPGWIKTVQERIVHEVQQFLVAASRLPQHDQKDLTKTRRPNEAVHRTVDKSGSR
jgi:hypothetical protein